MHRRAVPAALGSAAAGATAGCTRAGSIPSPDTDRRVVRLASVDDIPAEHEVELSVDILQSRIDADHTASLEVSTTNTGDRRAFSVSPDMCALFTRNRGGSEHPQGVWLHRADSTSHIDRKDDRWVADRPPDEPRVYPSYGCLATVYDTGDTVTNEYELWDDYRDSGYMDPGTSRWEERVRIFSANDGEQGDNDELLGSFHWGFDVELSVSRRFVRTGRTGL